MPDREGRALAAGDVIEVNGKSYRLRPAVAQHLCDLENEALRHFKKQYLQTYHDGLAMIEYNGEVKDMFERKLEEVSGWDLSKLPQKDAHDVSKVPINDEVKLWIKTEYSTEPDGEGSARALLANALDNKRLSTEDVERMTGVAPSKGRIRWDQWWVTASFEGQVSFLTTSVRYEHKDITNKDVANWPIGKIIEGAKMVERLTAVQLGNT